MIRRSALIRRPAAVTLTAVLAVACGGGGSNPTTPIPTPIPTGTPVPAPTPVNVCPIGVGSGYTCQGDVPGLLPQIDAAIDKLVRDHPELFSTENPPSAGGYLIYDLDAFYDGIIANLAEQRLCAQRAYADKDTLAIKEDNSYAEYYDIVTTQNRIRRGPVTFQVTCTPANFPLTAGQAVNRVSVSFFRYAGTTATGALCDSLSVPHASLPLGCRGTITATPRDSLGNKLPVELHAAELNWFVQNGDGVTIDVSPAPDGVPFNRTLTGKQLGDFSICATVGGVTGCLNGAVIP